ncbi:hypothetical protein FE257_010919 [Aspergillus nanangensis]|uniref:EF hand domain protein n=1 Tax=Aspergillus nanangensis TaxID=2582783 RepID=A0AAD4GY45_ASPNN|nr:hypothetical protein FE257_010919 [Aspergillus nanangensis]
MAGGGFKRSEKAVSIAPPTSTPTFTFTPHHNTTIFQPPPLLSRCSSLLWLKGKPLDDASSYIAFVSRSSGMSDSQSRPTALTRYRPALYLLTGIAAAYALVYISNQFALPSPDQRIRRRRTIRRPRRHEPEEPETVDTTPSARAIAHLEQLERQNGVYGTFRIETEDGRRVESGLLPSLLATRDQLMEDVGVPQAHAERMREMMEDTFLESFLALDFPPTHVLREGTPERNYLTQQLRRRGISRAGIERALGRFNEDSNYGEDLRRRRQNGERVTLSTSTFPDESVPVQNMDGGETVVDDQSVFSWRDGNNDSSPTREGQNLLNLLYHIAEDQARRDGYIHRGVTCNSCGAMPIQGIRYRCANCIDYDLCETCEAMQVHIKTHLFYKVRIPAPFLGNPRQSQPIWYPGKPAMLPRSLPRSLAKRLMKETNFENTELDALWDQFRCLANHEWTDDPNKLNMAIDRKTFDRCFVPNTSIRPPPPSLIYDRMFAFYDTNGDGMIGFEEFLKGLASLNNKSNDERLRRVFRGYDIDGDGYVERKDFLRVFRAYYTLSRELTRDMVAGMEDDFLEGGARDVVLGSQPISSAFPGSIPSGENSRTGEGKRMNLEGDMEIIDNEGVLRPDGTDTGNRHVVVGDAALRGRYGGRRPLFPTVRVPTPAGLRGSIRRPDDNAEDSSSDESSSTTFTDHWPPAEQIRDEDITHALGAARISTVVYSRMVNDDEMRVDETRRHGIDERWRRRAFYTDEEDGATAPIGYETDPDDMTDDDALEEQEQDFESHPPSPRSRSSSKVRFQDDLDDYDDVRSNPSTSSRSILVGERWGGFEVPEVEKDVGKEILYQVTQQGFNELLDILFKSKEDLLMEVYETRQERKIWAHQIEEHEKRSSAKNETEEDTAIPEPVLPMEGEGPTHNPFVGRPLGELLDRAGYGLQSPPLEAVQDRPVLAPPSHELRLPDDDVRPTHLAHPEEYDSGEYTSAESDADELNTTHSEGEADPEPYPRPADEAPYLDPTLPHHRPNADDLNANTNIYESPTSPLASSPSTASPIHSPFPQHPRHHQSLPAELRLQPNGTTSFPAPPSLAASSPEAEATAPKFSPSPIQPLPPPASGRKLVRYPSTAQLTRWAYLNEVEREAKERGGTGGKLNFDEFSHRMAADRGRRLAFVASWIEMASF